MNDVLQLVGDLSLTPYVLNGKCILKYGMQNKDSRLVGEKFNLINFVVVSFTCEFTRIPCTEKKLF